MLLLLEALCSRARFIRACTTFEPRERKFTRTHGADSDLCIPGGSPRCRANDTYSFGINSILKLTNRRLPNFANSDESELLGNERTNGDPPFLLLKLALVAHQEKRKRNDVTII